MPAGKRPERVRWRAAVVRQHTGGNRIDCCNGGVDACMVPESMRFPTANVFDVVIREYLLATGFLPMGEPVGLASACGDEVPF